jgi:hypothetical protein
MWTRQPGDPPYRWLDRVADITDPGLAAELRTARTTVDDAQTLSATVEVDGAYPDALNPSTITVTCLAHLATTTGRRDQACASTVTVTATPGGRLVVSAVA